MSRRILIAFLFLISISNVHLAQEIYLCESYTEDGKPVGPLNNLEVKPYGTAIYVLFNNKEEFGDPTLYLFIDKLVDDQFKPFDSKSITVEENDTWALTSLEFKEPGKYEIYFLNSSQNRLATTKFSTHFGAEFSNQVFTPSSNNVGSDDLVFCELVINGKPVNQFNTLSLARTEGQVFIYLDNHVPFGLDKIKLQVWKRSLSNLNFEELLDSKKFGILPEWNDTFFKYLFTQTGEYKIDIYDIQDNFISSSILTVTK